MSTIRVAAILNVIPHYRQRFWEVVHGSEEIEVTIFCQTELPDSGLRLVHDEIPQRVVPIDFWGNERLAAWQRLPWKRLRDEFDVLVWYGNPRLISGFVGASALQKMGKPIVIYGQAHTAGANPITEKMRLKWWQTFTHLLVYSDTEVTQLRRQGFKRQRIFGINNGLDQEAIDAAAREWGSAQVEQFGIAQALDGRRVTLSLGRIQERQRLALLVEALPQIVNRFPDLIHLVIGDGPMKQELVERARELGGNEHIRWLGPVYGEEQLAPWLLSAELLIHPGAVGLTLMHAFGYGLPVVTHDEAEQHMPEFCAFEEGVTGVTFRCGDVDDLVFRVCERLRDKSGTAKMGQAGLERVRASYNVDEMARRFVRATMSAYRSSS